MFVSGLCLDPYPCLVRDGLEARARDRQRVCLLSYLVFRVSGLWIKAHRLCVSLNSRLESNKEEEEETASRPGPVIASAYACPGIGGICFRGY